MKRATMVLGVFDDRVDADRALQALREAGFTPDQVGVAALQEPEPTAAGRSGGEHHRIHVDETTGILAGGFLGGVAGWLIGAATVAVPGLGALVAAGALVGAVGGAGIGAAAGGLIGYLVDHGLSHEEARYYQERVRQGAVLVTVRDGGRANEARTIMRQHGGHDFHTRPAS